MDYQSLERATEDVLGPVSVETVNAIVRGERPVQAPTLIADACDGYRPDRIVVLSPGVNAQGLMLDLDEASEGGAARGGTLRIEAAVRLYHTYGGVVVPTSQRSHLDASDRPDHWQVQRAALLAAGVPDKHMDPEKVSFDTVTEMAELLANSRAVPEHGVVALVTNRYHTPRAKALLAMLLCLDPKRGRKAGFGKVHQAMVERMLDRPDQEYQSELVRLGDASLEAVRTRNILFTVVAAEDVLGVYDTLLPAWETELYRSQSTAFAELMEAELRGIGMLLEGTYGRPKK